VNSASLILLQETAKNVNDTINICARRGRKAVKRQVSVHVKTRRRIKDILLLISKEVKLLNILS